jgi:hypothetical protein
MKIEKHLSPNCSEICYAINAGVDVASLTKFISKCQKNNLEVSLDFDEIKGSIPDLSSSQLAAILSKKGGAWDNIAKIKMIELLRKHTMTAKQIDAIITNIGEWGPSFSLHGEGGSVSLIVDDGLGTRGCPIIETGDCDRDNFPLVKKVSELFSGELYGHDGGHEDTYTEWLGNKTEEDKDE